jgi:hypothetical protein
LEFSGCQFPHSEKKRKPIKDQLQLTATSLFINVMYTVSLMFTSINWQIDKMKGYEDFLIGDQEQCDWDLAEDEISTF